MGGFITKRLMMITQDKENLWKLAHTCSMYAYKIISKELINYLFGTHGIIN